MYLKIADDLRRRIMDGRLAPGEQLPSIAALVNEYETSTTTARQAINLLRSEGHVVGQQGKGTFVRAAPRRLVRVVDHLYAGQAGGSPMAAAVESAGGHPHWDHYSHRDKATADVAGRLAIASGDPVMVTEYRFFSDGDPLMIATSYEPLKLTAGTPIELPEQGDTVGIVARFRRIGVAITHVAEKVTARTPRPYESAALEVPVGIPVLAIDRTYYREDLPVETADIVVAADTYTLTYMVPIQH